MDATVETRTASPFNKRMVAAREGDGGTIKWLLRDGDTWLLVPQHVTPRHQVRMVRPEIDFSIMGEVIKWIGQPSPARK
jgi:SOS-response transcriptional repressor LexA